MLAIIANRNLKLCPYTMCGKFLRSVGSCYALSPVDQAVDTQRHMSALIAPGRTN